MSSLLCKASLLLIVLAKNVHSTTIRRHIRGKEKLETIFQINNVLKLNVIGVHGIRN